MCSPGSAACRVARTIKEISDFLIICCVISFGLLKDFGCIMLHVDEEQSKRYGERLRRRWN